MTEVITKNLLTPVDTISERKNHLNKKAWIIAKKNLKEKLKNWQSMIWTIGFPLMMLIVYKFVFTQQEQENGEEAYLNGLSTFDVEFPGIVVYTVGMAIIGSAVMFASAKKSGILERMDTMPIGRANLFVGAIISETIFMNLQLIIVFGTGYGIMGAHFESWSSIGIGYFIALVFGIGAIGLGILIACFANSSESANGFGMCVHFPLMFASGSFFPFEANIVYATPHFWVKQVYLQFTVLGDSLLDKIQSSSLIGYSATETNMPIYLGILIILGFTIGFLILGIIGFQKKSKL
jgi:ABC-2 type transport system permease protein